MQTTFIYSLTCPISGEVKYIGKADDVKRRLRQHVYQSKKSDGRKSVWIRELLSEGLKPIIGVLDEVSYDDWGYWEDYWINQSKIWGFDLLNKMGGGHGYGKHNEETIEKIRKSQSGKNNAMYGKKSKGHTGRVFSEEHKKNISESKKNNNVWLGKKHSEETKRKMSEVRKGKPTWNKGVVYTDEQKEKITGNLTDEGRKKLSECGKKMKGRKHSEETKRKISETRKRKGLKPPSPKGRKMSEETKQKIRIKALEREKKKRELKKSQ
jgi:hypothetical protein